LLAEQRNLPEVGGVKVCQYSLRRAALAAFFFALTGCEEQSESVESTSSPAPNQAVASSNQVTPSKQGWITSYEQGQQEAKANNKLVLLDFTGSDWCGWCILLDREVFSKPAFKEYANKNLVLVELDFPKMKPVPDALKMQNIRLAQRYQVQGFPTIIVLNADGQVVAELGYMKGGPEAFIAVLEKLRQGNPAG